MRRLVILGAAATLLATPILTGQGQTGAQEIRAVEKQMAQAADKGDKAAYGSFLTDDFTWTDRAGKTRTKAEVLQGLAANNPSDKLSDEKISVYGTAAVETAARFLADPKVNVRYMRAWVKQAGRWQLVAHQGVQVTETPTEGGQGQRGAGAGQAQSPAPSPLKAKNPEEQKILDAFTALQTANAKADAAAFGQLVTDEFIGISPSGATRTKASRLEQLKTATPREVQPFAGQDMRIRQHGDLAVMTWRSGADSRTTNMVVMVKSQGKWLRAGVIATTATQSTSAPM